MPTASKPAPRYDCIAVHHGELWMRKRNRGDFVNALHHNITTALSEEKHNGVKNANDRFLIMLSPESNTLSIMNRLRCVFGVSWFAPAMIVPNSMDKIVATTTTLLKKGRRRRRIIANRSFKEVPFTSDQIVHELLKKRKRMGLNIDKESKFPMMINVTKDGTIICDGKEKGLGGLPVGTSGKALILLSGGIDSPVAAYYAMKRGLSVSYLHMHMYPTGEEAEKGKINELAKTLFKYSGRTRIFYAPSHPFLSYIMDSSRKYELILFKRFLLDLAARVAKKEGIDVIITGESLGQVASQTIGNLISESAGLDTFILRPLIGMDKQEIIDIAKRLDTYELSIQKYKDVCSINTVNPPTTSKPDVIISLYKKSHLSKALTTTMNKIYRSDIENA
jgi:thiamine biosynthesis protein ThiI